MKITEKKKDNSKVLIEVEGEMTIYSARDLLTGMYKYLDKIKNTEVDLSKVTKIDTSGFQLLSMAKKEVESKEKTFKIINPSNDVKKIFKLYGEAF
ncbi:MAG: STAS domain-containing protein [Spirochaetes bacterium]|nr:STAS domain-containing protein [Spirochaetota bacterium]